MSVGGCECGCGCMSVDVGACLWVWVHVCGCGCMSVGVGACLWMWGHVLGCTQARVCLWMHACLCVPVDARMLGVPVNAMYACSCLSVDACLQKFSWSFVLSVLEGAFGHFIHTCVCEFAGVGHAACGTKSEQHGGLHVASLPLAALQQAAYTVPNIECCKPGLHAWVVCVGFVCVGVVCVGGMHAQPRDSGCPRLHALCACNK